MDLAKEQARDWLEPSLNQKLSELPSFKKWRFPDGATLQWQPSDSAKHEKPPYENMMLIIPDALHIISKYRNDLNIVGTSTNLVLAGPTDEFDYIIESPDNMLLLQDNRRLKIRVLLSLREDLTWKSMAWDHLSLEDRLELLNRYGTGYKEWFERCLRIKRRDDEVKKGKYIPYSKRNRQYKR